MKYNKIFFVTLFISFCLFNVANAKETGKYHKWGSFSIYSMMNECYRYLNQSSLNETGYPIIPALGISQCACVNDKIHNKYSTEEEYGVLSPEKINKVVGEFSEECILEGAMGEKIKQVFLDSLKTPEEKKSLSWDDIQ